MSDIIVTRIDKFTVAYVNSHGESSSFPCTPDVGALFAAAPDLLAACEAMRDTHDKADAAIAKAKPHESRITKGP